MQCPSLAELPSPPIGKIGWPWTQETSRPDELGSENSWPRFLIVTPSYNQVEFLEETIRSILLQGYPNLEYVVIDGGSTDGSVEIIKKYSPWLYYWVSEPDKGQSQAINKGWSLASGEILAYLNSDDTYLPFSLLTVAREWRNSNNIAGIVGSIYMIDKDSNITSSIYKPFLPHPAPIDLTTIDHEKWFLPQQSGFWSDDALRKNGGYLKEDLDYTMDRELYYRLCRTGKIILMDDALATYRIHESSKTTSRILLMYGEAPKALAYTTGGDIAVRIKRWEVGRWRIAQGHLRFAQRVSSSPSKLWHVFLGVINRPSYLLRRKYLRLMAESLGLLPIIHWLRRRTATLARLVR